MWITMAEKIEIDRQPVAAVAVEAAFEEIGQRRHPRAQVQRGEEQRQQDQRESGHPLEVAEDHAVLVGRLGEAHQVDGGDVGGEHGQADDRPAERVAGQEVVAALAAAAALHAGPAAQPHDADQVEPARSQDRNTTTEATRGQAFTAEITSTVSNMPIERPLPRVPSPTFPTWPPLGYAASDNFPHVSQGLRGIPVGLLILPPTIWFHWAS